MDNLTPDTEHTLSDADQQEVDEDMAIFHAIWSKVQNAVQTINDIPFNVEEHRGILIAGHSCRTEPDDHGGRRLEQASICLYPRNHLPTSDPEFLYDGSTMSVEGHTISSPLVLRFITEPHADGHTVGEVLYDRDPADGRMLSAEYQDDFDEVTVVMNRNAHDINGLSDSWITDTVNRWLVTHDLVTMADEDRFVWARQHPLPSANTTIETLPTVSDRIGRRAAALASDESSQDLEH